MKVLTLCVALLGTAHLVTCKPPNIVFIMTDDQDLRLGSLGYMANVQKSIVGQGIDLKNHYGTVALCCPARASLFRGQAAHNTNNTHVGGPGGGYPKWLASGEHRDYLPLWLRKAGYTTAYFGKFMNGYSLQNYHTGPTGWDLTDVLVQPYIYSFNNVVMSKNSGRPMLYAGWHQTDVLRLKALEQLELMMAQEKPFYLEIAPASPHVVVPGAYPTVPLARHMFDFPEVRAPRLPNYNPSDEFQKLKPAWLRDLPLMNNDITQAADDSYRARLQGLQGIDEIVEDIVAKLDAKGILNETYIIYTTDNGFHLGQHRVQGGKGLPYVEDVNLPFAVRGPGIPAGRKSAIASTHVDIPPTLLEIAGLPKEEWPPFFDGRSLLKEWQSKSDSDLPNDGISREVLNVEYWGSLTAAGGKHTYHIRNNSYKSLRIVDEHQGYLFNRWCYSNQTELYDTIEDPYELINLAVNPSAETKRLMARLSGLLLVTKSCSMDNCRKPWKLLSFDAGGDFTCLDQAMDSKYDEFFKSLPHFGFQNCLPFQSVENEGPYYPAESSDLGRQWRQGTTDFTFWDGNGTMADGTSKFEGNVAQRYMALADLMADSRLLTDEEIGVPTQLCEAPDYCGQANIGD